MARIGSDNNFVSANTGGLFDNQGNPIVSADTTFGGSPLGVAARSQSLYGIANASFNILPPDPSAIIVDNQNPLPYWSVTDLSEGRMTAKSFYDTTTQTWAVELTPTAGSAGDSIALTTRSYLLNDDSLQLRQRAFATLEKINAYSSTNQWALVLSATYYDATGNQLSSYAIGTALDNATWTGLNGITTSGSAVISTAAQYVDIALTLTASATVTSTVKVQVNSVLLQTSSAVGRSFTIVDVFTSSGTWTRPAGVSYVSVLAIGAGGGGASGPGVLATSVNGESTGSGGGGAARIGYIQDFYVGDVGSVTISIGAAGSGGTAVNITKAAGSTTSTFTKGVSGGNGGATSFGTYLTVNGGSGGTGGTATSGPATPIGAAGAAATASTTTVFGITDTAGVGGGGGGASGGGAGTAGTASAISGISLLPLVASTYVAAGTAGSAGTVTFTAGVGTAYAGTATGAAGASGWLAGGGGSGGCKSNASATPGLFLCGSGGNGGAGGAGGAGQGRLFLANNVAGTVVVTGGAGGAAGQYSGAGGGAGAVAWYGNNLASYSNSVVTVTSGAGGQGSSGIVFIGYTS